MEIGDLLKYIIFISIIIITIVIIHYKFKLNKLAKYIVFLEDEYFGTINLLASSNEHKKIELLDKAKKTSLYKKIQWNKADNFEKFRMELENNNFINTNQNSTKSKRI